MQKHKVDKTISYKTKMPNIVQASVDTKTVLVMALKTDHLSPLRYLFQPSLDQTC